MKQRKKIVLVGVGSAMFTQGLSEAAQKMADELLQAHRQDLDNFFSKKGRDTELDAIVEESKK